MTGRASYMMTRDHPCRDCGKMTPYFPYCLACGLGKEIVEVEIQAPKTRRKKIFRRSKEGKDQ